MGRLAYSTMANGTGRQWPWRIEMFAILELFCILKYTEEGRVGNDKDYVFGSGWY